MAKTENMTVLHTTRFLVLCLVLAWAVHVVVYLAVPVRSTVGTHYSLIYSAAYLMACIGAAWISSLLASRLFSTGPQSSLSGLQAMLDSPRLLLFLSIASVIGVGLHYYDKLVINHFTGSCLALIREAWTKAAVARHGSISSWQSALGHLLSHFSFPLMFVLIFKRQMDRKSFSVFLIISVLSVIAYSALISTRSTILSYVLCGVLAYGLRSVLDRSSIRVFVKEGLAVAVIILVTAFVYSAFIFWDRIHCREEHAPYYAQSFYKELSAEGYDQPLNNDVLRLAMMFGIYVSNSSWNFEKSLAARDRDGVVFSSFAYHWLNRLGIIKEIPHGERAYPYGLISLPGAAWYDFGTPGMIGVAVLHGFLITLSGLLLARRGTILLLGVVTYLAIGLVTLWSPLCFAASTLSFPHLGFAYVVTSLLASLRFAGLPSKFEVSGG